MIPIAGSPTAGYLVAVLVAAVALILRLLIEPLYGDRMPFIPQLAAAGIATWYGGTRAGWLALAIGAVAGSTIIVEPDGSLGVPDPSLLLRLTVYAVAGAIWILTLQSLMRARRLRDRALMTAAAAGGPTGAASGAAAGGSQFANLLDQLPIGVGVFDAEGRWVLRNGLIRSTTGDEIPSLDPQGESRMRVWGPDGQPLPRDQWPGARALRGETVSPVDVLYTMEDGTERWVSISCAPFHGETGALLGAVVIAQDEDARKRAELALQSSEERLRHILDSAEDFAIVTLDTSGLVTSWNSGARNIFGYEASEMLGQDGRFMFTPEDLQQGVPDEEMRRALANGRSENERWHQRRDGTRFWASGLMMLLREPDTGRAIGFLKIMRDRTDAKRWEEALEREAEELKGADRRKNEFLATLAHELRNPLAPIRTGLELIKRAQSGSDVIPRATAMMERQVRQMVRLIDDLLDVSRITRRQIVLRRAPVPIATVLQHAVETSLPLIEEAGHTLELDVPGEPIVVDADETRLAQVFANLLNNAAKFTSPGGRIRVTARRDGPDVVVSVADNGAGIPREVLPRIFDLFSQANPSFERAHGGLGIGLTIVKELVEMHDGRVEVRSEGPGFGSVFTVRMPMRPGPPEPPPEPPAAPEAQHPAPPGVPRKVLVADDNPDSAASLTELLRMLGHDVRVAHDGAEAVETAEAFRPEVILLDISMPRLNGYEVCRRIRRRPWGTAPLIVALTGLGQDEDRRQSEDAGFDRHLVKPVDPAALERLLGDSV
jgi:PAS domain S-box-containing protein